MKTLKFNYLIVLLSLLTFSCVRDYDGPPLEEPNYDGEATMTIGQLKEAYKDIVNPTMIEYDHVIKGTIIGNDESGNIYKQLYIEDATGGITIGIEQNSIYATHRVGQEVYIDLHYLYAVKYGGELQIGYGDTNANRIPWQLFVNHIYFQGYPNEEKVQPTVVRINQLTDANVSTLIRLDNVSFVNGGKAAFTKDDSTTEEMLKDNSGNTIPVRTSAYSTFANELLPEGTGSVVGVLGRYNGAWQLMIRDLDDLIDFKEGGGTDPGTDPGGDDDVVFNETFGTGTHGSGNRPKIADFTGFDMKSPITYSDPSTRIDIRTISGVDAHAWFPANVNDQGAPQLIISGINTTGRTDLTFSFQLAANLYQSTGNFDLNVMSVKINGTPLTLNSTPVSDANGDDNKYYTFEFTGVIPQSDNVTIEFSTGASNTTGLRLDNIKIYTPSGVNL